MGSSLGMHLPRIHLFQSPVTFGGRRSAGGRVSAASGTATTKYEGPPKLLDDIIRQHGKDFISPETGIMTYEDGANDPFTMHMFYAPLCLGQWAGLRETTLVETTMSRKEKEILASFVSLTNECVFCMTSHKVAAKSQGAGGELQQALDAQDPGLLSDEKLGATCTWMMGAQKQGDSVLQQKPPFSQDEAPEVLGVALFFNYINRLVDTYLTRDFTLPSMPWFMKLMSKTPITQGFLEKSMESVFGSLQHKRVPGESLELMDHSPDLGQEFGWAKSNQNIAKAFAYWSWAIDRLAKTYIPVNVTQFVGDYIEREYTGEKPPLSRKWAFTATEKMEGTPGEKLAATFMLLVSFSRFQIDSSLKEDLEKEFPDSGTQRAFGVWSAFMTAKKIASWQGKACLNI